MSIPFLATHTADDGRYYMVDGCEWFYANHMGHWKKHWSGAPTGLKELYKKPWSGPEDGLPPVNERVEVLWSSITGEYVDALILAHDEDRAVFRFITGDRKGEYQADKLHFSAKFPNFRAIKTQKQIADEKRETAIREFMDVVGIDCRVTASKAVDAGFKREVV